MFLHDLDLNFAYRGQRNYIQGADLFNSVLESTSSGEISDIRMTAHGLILNCNCRVKFFDADPKQYEGKFRGRFHLNGKAVWFDLLELTDGCDCRRIPYDEQSIVDACRINDEQIYYDGSLQYTFMEIAVAMNKHLLSQTHPDIQGRWIFTGIELDSFRKSGGPTSLRVTHNFQNKLVKTRILDDGHAAGTIYFSLIDR